MQINSFMQISKVMKKFIYKICLLFLLVILFDVVFGLVMGKISKDIDLGGVGRDNYICDKATDDIVIFGSSRAEHHYNTQMMSDTIGVPCYNCGEEGCGIILAYGRLLMMLERYHPQTIIYDVTPDFDYLKGKDNHQYLYRLKHIFHLVFDSFFIVIQLVNHFLRLTPLKCIHTRESHSLEFPAFLVSFTQVIFFFFILHDVKPAKFFFEFFHFVTSCAFRYNLRILFSSSSQLFKVPQITQISLITQIQRENLRNLRNLRD